MPVFLTGEIQIGKSTIIRKVLSLLQDVSTGGFLTLKSAQDPDEAPSVYIMPVVDVPVFDEHCRVGVCGQSGFGMQVFPEVFDTVGVRLLTEGSSAQLMLMDEIGKMERSASVFSSKILEILDSNRPVLGVVRKEGSTELLNAVRTHPNVKLFEVTEANRDKLVDIVLREVVSELI